MRYILVLLFIHYGTAGNSQFIITPKLGVEFTGISYPNKGQEKRKDITVFNPDIEPLIGVELSVASPTSKISFTIERKNLGVSIGIINDSSVDASIYHKVSKGTNRKLLVTNHMYLSLIYEKRRVIQSKSRFMISYGGGMGIGVNHDSAYYAANQGMWHSTAFYGGINFVRMEIWSRPTGIGVFLHARAGISYLSKHKRERILFQLFWSQGLRKMLQHTIDYSYGYTPGGSGSGAKVTNYKFGSRGTTFGGTLNFPIYLSDRRKEKGRVETR